MGAYVCMCMCTFVIIYTVVALWIIYYCASTLWGVARVYGMCIVALFISEGILLQ